MFINPMDGREGGREGGRGQDAYDLSGLVNRIVALAF
jgi:hypothetical protein